MARKPDSKVPSARPEQAAPGAVTPRRWLEEPAGTPPGWLWAASFGVPLTVYVLTAAPTVSGEDAGELIAAAYTLGIAHPPGYPLWCLVAKLAATVLPVGDVAYRVNLCSALLGGLTCMFVGATAYRLSGSSRAALVAALSLAFSAMLWSQAVIAEVYALNTALLAGALFFALRWAQSRRQRYFYATMLALGLGSANHPTVWPLALMFIIYFLFQSRFELLLSQGKALWCGLAIFAGCLAVYLYLPLRSAANPYMNWGKPDTLSATLFHILRKQYTTGGLQKNPLSAAIFVRQLGCLVDFFVSQDTAWLLWLVPVGAALLRANGRRAYFRLQTVVFLLASVGFVVFTNFRLERQEIMVNSVFFVSSMPVFAVWLGLGYLALERSLLQQASPRPWGRGALWGCALLLCSVPLATNYVENDKSQYYWAYDFGENLLKTMEPDAVIFPSGDHNSFPIMYLQAVEHQRPDVTVADKYGYVEPDLYQDMGVRWTRFPDKRGREQIEDWIISHTAKPVYFTTKRPMDHLPGYSLAPVGVLYRVVRPGETFSAPPSIWESYRWRNLTGLRTFPDYTSQVILTDYRCFRGMRFFEMGRDDLALEEFAAAEQSSQDVKEVYNNLGSACAENGYLEQAARYYEKAVSIAEDYMVARRNLAAVYRQMGQLDLALYHYARLGQLNPTDLSPAVQMLSILEELGRLEEAISVCERLCTADPDNAAFPRRLGMLYRKVGDEQKALESFHRSLEMDPRQSDLLELMHPVAPSGPAP